MAFKVASLFSGIGGIDLGFKRAGFEIVWANEIDKYACKTYEHNFGVGSIVQGDIAKIQTSEIPNFDVLVAGFPCQPFSLAGKQKGFDDERGQLFYEIERIVKDKKPKVVFLENVSNLIEHNNGKSFERVFISLASESYVVKYSKFNPKTHANIPQQRDRVFLVAFKDINQANRFRYPEPIELTTKIADLIDVTEKHNQVYYYNEYHPLYEEMLQKVTRKGLAHRITDHGVSNSGSTICPTLTANMGTYTDRVHIIRDDFGIRKITPMECLRLQGYPKEFTFPSGININQAYKQVGNSVCVPIIEKVAKEIMKVLK